MPTKPEQADLLMAMYGRHGESPIPVICAITPADCFNAAYEAGRIAIKYMTPVILLTDGQLANGSEPWLLPDTDKLPPIPVKISMNIGNPDRVIAAAAEQVSRRRNDPLVVGVGLFLC